MESISKPTFTKYQPPEGSNYTPPATSNLSDMDLLLLDDKPER
jgi:hypothetical protein